MGADKAIRLQGIIASPDGQESFRDVVIDTDAEKAGERLARLLEDKGAHRLI
jgi:porphobilinogen deaminase